VGASVTLEVEGVVEALATVGAEVSLDVTVTLDVTVEEASEREDLPTHPALVLTVLRLHS